MLPSFLRAQMALVMIFTRRTPLPHQVLIGGENRAHEKARLRKGVTLVVATPGRLQDHLDHTASFRTGEQLGP